MTFTLDTSGGVVGFANGVRIAHRWSDLSPFAQGYVEAMFASLREWIAHGPRNRYGSPTEIRPPGFSDLSPEALALILRDCDLMLATRELDNSRARGVAFWNNRNGGWNGFTIASKAQLEPRFPPLTPYLSDEGKVCLR